MPSNSRKAALQRIADLREAAVASRTAGRFEDALTKAQEALTVVVRDLASAPPGELLLLIGNCFADLGRYGDADQSLALAAETFLDASRNVEYAQAMIGRGRVLAEQGEDRAATEFFLALLKLELPAVLESQILNNLGILARRSHKLEQATEFLLRDIALCEKMGDEHGAAVAHFNLAAVRFEANDVAAGREHAAHATRVFAAAGMEELAARALQLARSSVVRQAGH